MIKIQANHVIYALMSFKKENSLMYLKFVTMTQFIKSDMYEEDETVLFYVSVGDLKSLLLVLCWGFKNHWAYL